MIIYCKQDGSVQSVPSVIPQGSLMEPVTVLAPAPSAVCSLRIMPASHEALDPVIATGMEIDGEFRAYSLHLPPTVTEWPGVCRYQVMMTDANGRQTASYSGTFTIQRGAVDPDLLPGNVGELSDTSLGDMLTLLAGFQTAVIAVQTQVDKIQTLIDEGKVGGNSEEIMNYLKKLREYLSVMRVNWWSPRLAAALLSVCAGVLSLAACGAYVEGSGAETKYETLTGSVTELQTILGEVTDVGEVPTVPESSGGGTDEPTGPEEPTDPEPILSLTLNGEAVSVYSLPYTNGGLTISGTYDGRNGTVTVSAESGYRLSACTINAVSTSTYEAQDEAVSVVAGTVRQYIVTLNLTNVEAYTDASMNQAFTSPHYVDAGSQVSVFLVAAQGHALVENGILINGLSNERVESAGGGFMVYGNATSGNVTVTAVARDPVMQTASLSIVSAPTDGSYSAVLYAQTESGTDGETVTDWSAIPAGASYRLAVTANGSYKITSGTVLTCNGATVAPYTTTQGISYVYHLTPAAGDVYALTVATEANGSGGGTEEPEVTVPDGEYALELVYGATGTADSNELDASSGTYDGIVSSLGRNHMISKLIPYDAGKTYVFTAVATTYTAHVQLVAFDEAGNYMDASLYGSNSEGAISSTGTYTFTLTGGTLTPSAYPQDTWSMPGNASKIAIFGRTKGNCATNVPAGKEYLALTLEISSV